jgi:predicted metalloprotease
MAMWDKITSRGNVEDRRGMSGTALVGGTGVTGIVLYLLLTYLSGGNLGDVVGQLATSATQQQNISSADFEGQDSYEVFVSTVLGSANDTWERIFAAQNKTYTPPRLVLFRGATQSACGGAYSAVGPHYCPEDETVYLDETFFTELTQRFGAKGGDVAQAYVIAHEVGHHAQKELGIMDAVGSSNADSVKLELQADCFAGIWANSLKDRGIFEPGEINEALDAAAAVGDDRIQKMTQGYVSPETWTHGSSQERDDWFNKGYDTGSLQACDTF